MEVMMMTVCAIAALSCLSVNLLIAHLVWQRGHEKKQQAAAAPEELPEEREARRVAAEAQRKYEQGFIDMMTYMGQPQRKDGEG